MQNETDKIKSDSATAVLRFNRDFYNLNRRMTYIGTGSSGGKAQGLIRIHDLLVDQFNDKTSPLIEVNIPIFTVIRTDVFDAFMKKNNLYDIAFSGASDERIAHAFQNSELPFDILGDLRALISQVHHPLAIRSSSRLEDAANEPFAGIYATKMTPNNQPDTDTRFRKLVEAIKFVYASSYFQATKSYLKATAYKIEEEKMAVIVQEVVGRHHGERYYPDVSGVVRSYNFYPIGKAKPEDGVVNLALGLGKTIVDEGISWSYALPFPKVSPPFGSVAAMLKTTQKFFWAINMGKPPDYNPLKETEFMIQQSLMEAEKDGTLRYTASTIDNHSGRISMGTGASGARIINFAPLFHLKEIPLNDLLKKTLKICEAAFNTPVEIEFALTFSPDKSAPHRFGFLQVRPMIFSTEVVVITDQDMAADNILVRTEHALGNGIIKSISDIVFVKPESFEARVTRQIALEIERMNRNLLTEKRPYLLIGFGRWGSSDSWLGIPVNWGQISGARVIIEAVMDKMNVELSQGSHFFHNLNSFQVSYFSVPFVDRNLIDWEWLNKQKVTEESTFVRRVTLPSPLQIKVDGRQRRGIIFKTAGK
jgi:phosphoenolpyruvate synthase/pyruvate phosphate dikinase